MGNGNCFKIILGVLLDWRVIITVVVMLLVIEFAKFVANYTKKLPKPKTKKEKKQAGSKPKKEGKKEEGEPESDSGDKGKKK